MKKSTLSLFCALLALVCFAFMGMTNPANSANTLPDGVVTGQVVLKGSLVQINAVDLGKYPDCAGLVKGKLYPNGLVLGDGNTLGNIFVQIKNAPKGNHPVPKRPVVIEQKNCLYMPYVTGVRVGQEVVFKNSDGILHNVHGLPKVNKGFNIGMPPTVMQASHTFTRPERPFEVKCDVHPWMNGYVAVMTHPYFAVTGSDGKFSIPNLPDGTYELVAWHPKLGTQTFTTTVRDGKSQPVNIQFTAR